VGEGVASVDDVDDQRNWMRQLMQTLDLGSTGAREDSSRNKGDEREAMLMFANL
jgi:hypothetical protein